MFSLSEPVDFKRTVSRSFAKIMIRGFWDLMHASRELAVLINSAFLLYLQPSHGPVNPTGVSQPTWTVLPEPLLALSCPSMSNQDSLCGATTSR